jgi:hypothetical protein
MVHSVNRVTAGLAVGRFSTATAGCLLPGKRRRSRRRRVDRPQRLRDPRADLTRLRKQELGSPQVSRGTEAERAAGMCWTDEGEPYNNGRPFKVTSRGTQGVGVMVTILADNYFGYCKERIQDTDQLQREPVRTGRGSARRGDARGPRDGRTGPPAGDRALSRSYRAGMSPPTATSS